MPEHNNTTYPDYKMQHEFGCLSSIGLWVICGIPIYFVVLNIQDRVETGTAIVEMENNGAVVSDTELDKAMWWKHFGNVNADVVMARPIYLAGILGGIIAAIVAQIVSWYHNRSISAFNRKYMERRNREIAEEKQRAENR